MIHSLIIDAIETEWLELSVRSQLPIMMFETWTQWSPNHGWMRNGLISAYGCCTVLSPGMINGSAFGTHRKAPQELAIVVPHICRI
jgi:hypothetical protein